MGRRRPTRLRVAGGMRVRAYEVLSRAVEGGVEYGWRRAHKHTETPGEDAIKEQVIQAVLSEVCEWFAFDDESSPST